MSNGCYYLDTNALYAYYRDGMGSLVKNPRYAHYQAMSGGEVIRRCETWRGAADVE